MMGTTLGSAFVTIKPEMRGMSAAINGALGGISTSGSGERMGSGLVDGIKTKLSTASAVIAGVAAGIASNAAGSMMAALDAGIRRSDIINNFPKVMSNFNIGAKDAEASIGKLSDRLIGLPTGLDAAAAGVQRLVSKNNDINRSTDLFLAMNDAILAGGAPMDIQTYAMEQLTQAYSKGKPDMMEWRSIMAAMPAQLNQVAEAMGYGAGGADDLGEALRNGDVTMDEFMDTIVRLDSEGTGGFQSFADQAKNATGGIETSIANVDNAISRFWQGILDAVGQEDIKGAFSTLGDGIDEAGKVVSGVISSVMPKVKDLVSYIKDNGRQVEGIVTAIASGFVAFKVGIPAIEGVAGVLKSFNAGASAAKTSAGNMSSAFSGATGTVTSIGSSLSATATASTSLSGALGIAAGSFSHARDEGQGLFSALKTGAQRFKETEAGAGALSSVTSGLTTGLIGAGIALAGIAIEWAISHFAQLREHEDDVRKATEDLTPIMRDGGDALTQVGDDAAGATGGLTDYAEGIDTLIKKHADLVNSVKETFSDIDTDASLVEGYRQTIHDLADQSGLSAEKQAELQQAVAGINEICGTNIQVIDGVNGMLSESVTAIDLQTEAWRRSARAQAAQEQMVEFERQRIGYEQQLVEAQGRMEEKQRDLNDALRDGIISYEDYEASMANTGFEVSHIEELMAGLDGQMQALEGDFMANREALAASTEALDAYIRSTEGLAPALEDAGVDVAGFEQALSTLGFSTDDLARGGTEKIIALATSWTENASGMTQAAIDLGIALPGSVADGLSDPDGLVAEAMDQLRTVGIEDPASEIPGLMQMTASDGIDAMSALFMDRAKDVEDAAAKDALAARSGISTLADDFEGVGAVALGTLNTVLGKADGVEESASVIATEAEKGASDFDSSAIGSDFALGFKSGIASKVTQISSEAAAMVRRAIESARSAQQSASPSKVMRREGGFFGEGYGLGIEDEIPSVVSSVRDMVDDAAAEAMRADLHVQVSAGIDPSYLGASGLQSAASQPATGDTYNIRIDSDLIATDKTLQAAFLGFMGEVRRHGNMQMVGV